MRDEGQNELPPYLGNGAHEWQTVFGPLNRIRVPGGWMYSDKNYGLVFVPVIEQVFSITIANVMDNVTLSAAGWTDVIGTIASTLDISTMSASGLVGAIGTLDQTLNGSTMSASGSVT